MGYQDCTSKIIGKIHHVCCKQVPSSIATTVKNRGAQTNPWREPNEKKENYIVLRRMGCFGVPDY